MKSFKQYITELSIYADKYTPGVQFKISSSETSKKNKTLSKIIDSIKEINEKMKKMDINELDINIDYDTILTKKAEALYEAQPNKELFIIPISPRGTNIVYASIGDDPTIFKFLISSAPDFNKIGGYKMDHSVYEVASAVGVFLDGNQFLNDMGLSDNKRKEFHRSNIDRIREVITNNNDFETKGSTILLDILNNPDNVSIENLSIIYSLIAGMSDFVNDILDPSFKYICHNSINNYYKAEEDNALIQKDGEKQATPDIIISTKPHDKLISLVSTENIEVDSETGICKIGDLRFVLVSLKKSYNDARLGSILSFVKNKYGTPDYDQLLDTTLANSYLPPNSSNIIFENWLKASLTKFKDFSSSLIGKMKEKINKLKTKFIDFRIRFYRSIEMDIHKNEKKYFNKLMKIIGSKENIIREDFEGNGVSDRLKILKDGEIKKIHSALNSRLNDIFSIAKKTNNIIINSPNKLNSIASGNDRYKLFANYCGLEILYSQINKSSSNINRLSIDIMELLKEMYFGKTTLPIYKVYGKNNNHNSYDYLGTSEKFKNKIIQDLEKYNVPVIGIYMTNKNTKNYYALYSYFCLGYNEDAKEILYTENTLSTNGTERFTFRYDGSNLKTYDKLMDKFK